MNKKNVDEYSVMSDYANGYGLDYVCKKYGIGKLRAKEIIERNGVKIRPKSSFTKKREKVVDSWRVEKYKDVDGYHYIAVFRNNGKIFTDYKNQGGYLTSYIKSELNIEIPNLYSRRKYYEETGNYWWEQWFDIKLVKNCESKKCPYCGWETNDIENKSGSFSEHIRIVHNISPENYLKEFPNDEVFFKRYINHQKKISNLTKDGFYVVCPICNNHYEKLTETHLKTHGMTMVEFREKYPDFKILSNNMREETFRAIKLSNLVVSKKRFISKYEKELRDFLTKEGVDFETNRQILIGKEIDILIPNNKLAIEFNGLKWHTEWFGKKDRYYHLKKTVDCESVGYHLIHIFEDEFVNNKDIVFAKIKHALKKDYDLPKIMGRKCVVREIYKNDAEEFLKKYHIQGFARSTVYLGAFYNDVLVSVMCFKNGSIKNYCWELTRYASDYNYRFQGVASKMLNFFITKYLPDKIISFADRRWTMNNNDNLYTKIGFKLDKITKPDYHYYDDTSKNNQKYKRIHKMSMSKSILSKKYGLPLTMTEKEMAKELGYDRIWDCGLLKYVWSKEK